MIQMVQNFSFSEETAVDAANYGHSRNHVEHQIISPVPGLSYQDILRILSIIDVKLVIT